MATWDTRERQTSLLPCSATDGYLVLGVVVGQFGVRQLFCENSASDWPSGLGDAIDSEELNDPHAAGAGAAQWASGCRRDGVVAVSACGAPLP